MPLPHDIPTAWCGCEHCRYARETGGINIRATSSALLDGGVLLEFNCETVGMADRLGVRLLDVEHFLSAHTHHDHFDPEWLVWRRMMPGMDALSTEEQRARFASRYTVLPHMTLWANHHVRRRLDSVCDIYLTSPNQSLSFHVMESSQTYRFKDDLAVTPVQAEHGSEDFMLNYILQCGGNTMLYALDTGGYSDALGSIIARFQYDLAVMEGTFGCGFERSGHMSLCKNLRNYRLMIDNGFFAGEPRYYLSHLGPHWTPLYDEFVRMVEPFGVRVAYDGLTVTV